LSNPKEGIDRMKGFYRGLLALNSIEKAITNQLISKKEPRENRERTE